MKNRTKLPVVTRCLQGGNPPRKGRGLRLAVYQGMGKVGDRAAIRHNLKNLERWAKKAAKERAQILLLPELFLCGYNLRLSDRERVALTLEAARKLIAPIARKHALAIVCPYAERAKEGDGIRYYDSILFVDHKGKILHNYRKTHLWGKAEKAMWHPGYREDPTRAYRVVKYRGIRIGLLNCYEAEFPELARILRLEGAQLILIPTAADVGTCDEKGVWQAWAYPDISKTLIPAHAFENDCFIAYANRALFEYRSDDGSLAGVYLGNSVIAGPDGRILAAAENVETLLVADCRPGDHSATHPEGQSDYLRDRRPELYRSLCTPGKRQKSQETLRPHIPNREKR